MADKKAQALKDQAEALLALKGFKAMFKPIEGRRDTAADLYSQAAAQYKRARDYEKAAEAHVRQAELLDENKNVGESCNAYKQACIMYKKGDCLKEAVTYNKVLVDIYRDADKNVQAAKAYRGSLIEKFDRNLEIALLETEIHKGDPKHGLDGAIKAWEEAAECHDMQDQEASKTECETKVADLCAENDQLPKAAKIYEALAARTPRSGTNWAAPKHLWKAMLCHMVLESKSTGDLKTSLTKFENHQNSTPKFADCREAKLLAAVFASYDDLDADAFTSAVAKYDRISRCGPWETKMLLALKNVLTEGAPTDAPAKDADGEEVDSDDEFA